MKVDNIKNYLSEELREDFIKIIDEVYSITEHLNETYPGYRDWFFEKQVKSKKNLFKSFITNSSFN